jgi:uncharacterized protein YyaL (SSP411 family)
MASKTNHLASSLSPYLLQHQHNPVNWYPWAEEALEKAKREDKPIFLSIGYSACHWCHVMERESFENEQIAKLLNEHFISIKVDREERPDLDSIYMSCVQAMTGHGGWPMSIFMTPDLKPFLAGTYFPPTPRYGMPGFESLLLKITQLWKFQRQDLLDMSEEVFQYLNREESQQDLHSDSLSRKGLEQLVIDCQREYDSRWGGFGSAPKFPQTSVFFALLQQHHHQPNEEILEMVTFTLEHMYRGGIYDQIGGGFHRYSVDEKWLIPHFEKMLYDNALLSRLYLEAYQLFNQQAFLDVALHTLQYLIRDMQDSLGGFYSAEDADSEGVEGKYYLWSRSEIEKSLKNAELFCHTYGVKEEGNFEGRNILHQANPISSLPLQDQAQLALDCQTLLKERHRRVRPGLDDKVLVDWNALTISSLTKAYQITGQVLYLEAAQKATQFIESHMTCKGHLYHLWRKALGETPGFLEDYANYILALIDLYECDFKVAWLQKAKGLLEKMIELFWDSKNRAFYTTSLEHRSPLVRKKEFSDNMTPAGNAQAAIALLKLGCYYDNSKYQQMAVNILSKQAAMMQKMPRWYGTMLCAADHYLSSMQQIVLFGNPSDQKTRELLQVIYDAYLPHKVFALCNEGSEELPMNRGKAALPGQVLVCYQGHCYPPISDLEQLRSLLLKGR